MKIIRSWYRKRRRFAALSRGERRLNWTIGILLVIAVTYAFAQHYLLIDTPELFSGGAHLGELFYDLAIGYVGAYVFYLLNIRLPIRRDRRNIYPHIGPMVGLIVQHANDLIQICYVTAKMEPPARAYAWESIEELCRKIGPNDEVPSVIPIEIRHLIDNTVAGTISDRLSRVRANIEGIMKFSSLLATDLVDLLTDIDNRSRFITFEAPITGIAIAQTGTGVTQIPIAPRVSNTDLSVWAERIFEYLTLIDLLDEYAKTYLGDGIDYRAHVNRPELAEALGRRRTT